MKGRGIASREHLLHHAHPDRTDPFTRFLSYLGVVVAGTAISNQLTAEFTDLAVAIELAPWSYNQRLPHG